MKTVISGKSVSDEQLKVEMLRRRYAGLLDRPEVYPSDANWDFIITHRLGHGLSEKLYRKYLVSALTDEAQLTGWHKIALRRFPEYIKVIDRELAIRTVYSDSSSAPMATLDIIKEARLFDAPMIIACLEGGEPGAVDFVIEALDAWQPSYDKKALDDMKALNGRLHTLPVKGGEVEREGWLSRGSRYVCPEGHDNPSGTEYCLREGCGRNRYGLTAAQVKAIDDFEARIEVLASMLSQPSAGLEEDAF